MMNTASSSSVPVLTIDGPSGVGKGTIAKKIAAQLGWHLLDSGALYRLTALSAKRNNVSFESPTALAAVAERLDVVFQPQVEGTTRVLLNGDDVSRVLRTEDTGSLASIVAAIPEVRDALLTRQRDFRKPPGLVADGRDMGTVVFPDTRYKVFLTADAEVRAKRRFDQLKDDVKGVSLPALLADIRARDERDLAREASPLKPADDALMIDTSNMSVESVYQQVLQIL